MSESVPIFDDIGQLFGTVVFTEEDGVKKIYFRMRDSTMIDLSDINHFTQFLRKNEIPEEEITKAIRFFNQRMFSIPGL
ncbi:MAG: hypothetical protein J7L61_01665 [Thermoplasmata archaeon]|nr:hypothetical protein [Thermoplasmata archaeon]